MRDRCRIAQIANNGVEFQPRLYAGKNAVAIVGRRKRKSKYDSSQQYHTHPSPRTHEACMTDKQHSFDAPELRVGHRTNSIEVCVTLRCPLVCFDGRFAATSA